VIRAEVKASRLIIETIESRQALARDVMDKAVTRMARELSDEIMRKHFSESVALYALTSVK
jgi:hypothetical protein